MGAPVTLAAAKHAEMRMSRSSMVPTITPMDLTHPEKEVQVDGTLILTMVSQAQGISGYGQAHDAPASNVPILNLERYFRLF